MKGALAIVVLFLPLTNDYLNREKLIDRRLELEMPTLATCASGGHGVLQFDKMYGAANANPDVRNSKGALAPFEVVPCQSGSCLRFLEVRGMLTADPSIVPSNNGLEAEG